MKAVNHGARANRICRMQFRQLRFVANDTFTVENRTRRVTLFFATQAEETIRRWVPRQSFQKR